MSKRTDAENQVMFKRTQQAEAWSTARYAIAEYLQLYGIREERALGAANDTMDEYLNDIIDEEGGY